MGAAYGAEVHHGACGLDEGEELDVGFIGVGGGVDDVADEF